MPCERPLRNCGFCSSVPAIPAEARWLKVGVRHLKADLIEALSAGVESHGLDPRAVKVIAESGVDISGHWSKKIDELDDLNFDYVMAVCDQAKESCPLFPGDTKLVHVGFQDPPREAIDATSEEERLVHYRRVRDEIRAFVETLPEAPTHLCHQ